MSSLFDGYYKHKRVLVTGHTGFKGSWLSMWLHALGAEVIGYALEPPTAPNLFEICNLDGKIISLRGDVRDSDKLRDVFDNYQPEMVFHMAAQSLVRRSYMEPIETYNTNIMGTVNVLEACRNTSSVKAVINVTSDKCYENNGGMKTYSERDPMGGYDPYSSSKGCAELVTNAYLKSFFNTDRYEEHGISLASVRAGNVIGGGDWADDRFIPDCIKAFVKNKPVIIRYPDAVRPWQHVLEPLYGYLLLAQHLYQDGPAFSGAWNFGSSDEHAQPVKWLFEQLSWMWGNNVSWTVSQSTEPHESLYLKLDSSKAKTKLGWYSQWDLETTLRKTAECYKAHYNNEDVLEVVLKQIGDYETEIKKTKAKNSELQVL